MKIFTIGFTKKNAKEFFTLLKHEGLVRLIDARLNNTSQLAGFTKKNDLQFFAKEISGIDYIHLPELAPTKLILDNYKKNGGNWSLYEKEFISLMNNRAIEKNLIKEVINGGCLLCSESTPDYCHRRLVAEYLKDKWGDVEIYHL